MSNLIGQTFDIYRIERLLGQGSMASTYQATDLRANRLVTLKILYPHLSAQETFQRSFLQTMRALIGMNHPHIVHIYAADLKFQQLFVAMEYLAGGSLRDYLYRLYAQSKKLPPLKTAVTYVSEVADALHYAHDQKVLHEDIKPDNILLKPKGSEFEMVLTDLGMKQLLRGNLNSEVLPPEGTLPYMSPEGCLGRPLTARSDIYSLGIILYYLTVGRLPYMPRTPLEAYQMHTEAPLPLPTSLRPSLPLELENIIRKCLEKDPGKRYQSAAELSRALQKLLFQLAHELPTIVNTTPDDSQTLSAYETVPSPAAQYTAAAVKPEQFGQDRLVVAGSSSPTRARAFDKEVLIVGRDPYADIVLDEKLISRYHVRIERLPDGRYQVTDLDSMNGSWLGALRLKPNEARVWNVEEELRVGTTRLRLEPAASLMLTSPRAPEEDAPPDALPGEVAAPPAERTPLQISVELAPEIVVVMPGVSQSCKVTIFNKSGRVDQFQVQVRGLASDWVTAPDASPNMLPDSNTNVTLIFNPPKSSRSAAGMYPFEVVVSSTGQPNTLPVVVNGQLRVDPFFGYSSDVQPQRLKVGGKCFLTVTNAGNTPQMYTVKVRDREDGLNLSYAPDAFTLNAGAQQRVTITVAPKRRALAGALERLSFDVVVSEERADSQPNTQRVEVSVPPYVANWLITLLLSLLFLCTGVSFCSVNQVVGIINGIVQTGNAQATLDFQAGQTATFDSDEDGDGLSLAQEIQAGTLANNPDTDNDGLNDLQEIQQWATNPLARDTDGDTLLDGAEAGQECRSPKNPDTDGDGLRDNVDPDPCVVNNTPAPSG
ncbi:MAG: protein kinase [Chloroflexi bacterium]|nr:protein kinase [Chloroflexota bacterium]